MRIENLVKKYHGKRVQIAERALLKLFNQRNVEKYLKEALKDKINKEKLTVLYPGAGTCPSLFAFIKKLQHIFSDLKQITFYLVDIDKDSMEHGVKNIPRSSGKLKITL